MDFRQAHSDDWLAHFARTCTAFTVDGSDGHFARCVRQLTSPEVIRPGRG